MVIFNSYVKLPEGKLALGLYAVCVKGLDQGFSKLLSALHFFASECPVCTKLYCRGDWTAHSPPKKLDPQEERFIHLWLSTNNH